MSWKKFSVKVPASTANLGPGFDSIGLALDLFMTVHVAPAAEWKVTYQNESYQHLSGGAANLLVSTAQAVAEKHGRVLPPAELLVETDIPLGRGLGSSASAIAAGIEIADRIAVLELPLIEKMRIGSEMEGHPDNITASQLGGLTISYFDDDHLETIHVPEVPIAVLLLVPPHEFLTTESRGLLPQTIKHDVSVKGSAAGNVLCAALLKGDWQTAGRMMEKDQFHEPFRKSMFADFNTIQTVSKEAGAYGCSISGAGPSLFIAVPNGEEEKIAATLTMRFPDYECLITRPSSQGIEYCETVT